MDISLYNNTGAKVFANVNGIEYIINPESTSVARCNDNAPVIITLSQKMKSFSVLNFFSFDNIMEWWESASVLVLNPTYVLNLNGSDNQQFKISDETFICDKYYQYERLYLDDPIIKNNCTYEITRKRKIKKRVKLFNAYTGFLVIGFLLIALSFILDIDSVKSGTFFAYSDCGDIFLLGVVIGLAGVYGRIRVKRRYKKVTDEEYVQGCFRGYIEENK